MDLALTFNAAGPLYRQLYSQIKRLIQQGDLKQGTRLPSVLALMRQLNISKTTVETAYHMLLEEGYISSKERSGMIVISPAAANLPNERVKRTSPGQAESHEMASKEIRFDFSLLTVDGASFPMRLWKSIMGEALSLHSRTIHEYGDVFGEFELRESVSRYLRNSRGAVCEPEQIVIGNGLSGSLRLLAGLLGEQAAVGIEAYGIAQVREAFVQNRFKLAPVSLEAIVPGSSEQALARLDLLYVTPSHRPSGIPLPYATRLNLLRWACDSGKYIIEDDYDGELRLEGKPIPSLQGVDSNGAVIYLGTFSKVFTPALRLNYMIIPKHLTDRLEKMRQSLSGPSRMDQWAMNLFISRGHWYRHLRKMRKIYRGKYELLRELIKQNMPESVRIANAGTGLHIELSITADATSEELIDMALKAGVRVYGSPDRQTASEARIYLGFGGIGDTDMKEAVLILRKAWSPCLED